MQRRHMIPTGIQAKDLGASAARPANELQKHSAGAHGNADDANLGRDWHAVVSLKGHRTQDISGVKSPDRRMSVTRTDGSSSRYMRKEYIKFLGFTSSALLLGPWRSTRPSAFEPQKSEQKGGPGIPVQSDDASGPAELSR